MGLKRFSKRAKFFKKSSSSFTPATGFKVVLEEEVEGIVDDDVEVVPAVVDLIPSVVEDNCWRLSRFNS